MWPLNKKKTSSLNLPPLPSLKSEEITLLPEDGSIPDELPELEIKSKVMEQKNLVFADETPLLDSQSKPVPSKVNFVQKKQTAMVDTSGIIASKQRFVRSDVYGNIMSEIMTVNSNCDDVDSEVENIINLKNKRDEKVSDLQDTLEEVGKKLMQIESSVFGG